MKTKMEHKLLNEIKNIYVDSERYIRECKIKQAVYLTCSFVLLVVGVILSKHTIYPVVGYISLFIGGYLMMLGLIYGSSVKSTPLITKYSELDRESIESRLSELEK